MWFQAGVAATSILLCTFLLRILADSENGRLYWLSAAIVQAACLLAVMLPTLWILRRQRQHVLAQRAAMEIEIRGLEEDTGALFEHLSRDFDPQFDAVRDEAAQIHVLLLDAIEKLVASFTALNLASRRQRDHALAVIDRQHEALIADADPEDKVNRLRSLEIETARVVDELAAITANIGVHVDSAVTSLQFQDMTSQLLEHITRRVDAMQAITRQITVVPASPSAATENTYPNRIARLRMAVRETAELVARNKCNPVAQRDMNAGEIELF